MADVESRVLDIIAEKAKADRASLTRATPLADLALDSMDFVEVVFDLEEAFDISIPFSANSTDASGANFQTVGDVVDQVVKLVPKDGAG